MMTHLRPDIAQATEQTVLNLKEVESRIAALRNDLAALCQGIGHPEAARIAALPSFGVPSFGGVPSLGFASPWSTPVGTNQPFGFAGFGMNPPLGSVAGFATGSSFGPYAASPQTLALAQAYALQNLALQQALQNSPVTGSYTPIPVAGFR